MSLINDFLKCNWGKSSEACWGVWQYRYWKTINYTVVTHRNYLLICSTDATDCNENAILISVLELNPFYIWYKSLQTKATLFPLKLYKHDIPPSWVSSVNISHTAIYYLTLTSRPIADELISKTPRGCSYRSRSAQPNQ